MNWDYIAGLFDGEGSVHIRRIKHPYKSSTYGKRIYKYLGFCLGICNSNLDVLEEIKNFLQIGHINTDHPERRSAYGHLPVYTFEVTRRKDCLKLAKELVKHTYIKREALEKFIKIIENYERYHAPKTAEARRRAAKIAIEAYMKKYTKKPIKSNPHRTMEKNLRNIHKAAERMGVK